MLPFFIFGDFNFRLNGRRVVDALDVELRFKNDDEDPDENCCQKFNKNIRWGNILYTNLGNVSLAYPIIKPGLA